MYCSRCQGLMVVDSFIDMQEDTGQLWISAWRCVNCGQVHDPGIMRNRLEPRSVPVGIVERFRRRRMPTPRVPVRLSA